VRYVVAAYARTHGDPREYVTWSEPARPLPAPAPWTATPALAAALESARKLQERDGHRAAALAAAGGTKR
jgi:hypothetical protein